MVCWLPRRQAREVRQGFVRKVLGLVLLQLLVTAGASFAFLYVHPLKARRPAPRAPSLPRVKFYVYTHDLVS